jgi:hypothetical protein
VEEKTFALLACLENQIMGRVTALEHERVLEKNPFRLGAGNPRCQKFSGRSDEKSSQKKLWMHKRDL